MGWLFGKRKTPKVPFPKGTIVDESALNFPKPAPPKKIIQPSKFMPESVKEAVGVKGPVFPDLPEPEMEPIRDDLSLAKPLPPIAEAPTPLENLQQVSSPSPVPRQNIPLHVKVDVYQKILGKIDDLKDDLDDLSHHTRELEESEFNEEDNFDKLKKNVRNLHDKMLQIDKTLFSS